MAVAPGDGSGDLVAGSSVPVAGSTRRGGGRPEGVRGGRGHEDVSGNGGEATLGRPCGAPARGAGHDGHGGVATWGLAPCSSCREAVEAPGEGPTMWRQLPGGQASAGAVRHCFGFFGSRRAQQRWRGAAWRVEAWWRRHPGWAAVAVVRECRAMCVLLAFLSAITRNG